MNYFNQKTPLLGEGTAQCAMTQFLTLIKSQRGLTKFIEDHGVNGQWLKPDEPYDIRFSKLSRILEIMVMYRETDEEFMEMWNTMGIYFIKLTKLK